MNDYKPTIGIEVHLELKTNSKVFSPSKNNYSDPANTNINEIDLGYPGTLPTVNEQVIENAIKACLALNMKIAKVMHFDRKNYYYADLPKGYQITQMETPIGKDGFLEIEIDKKKKKIGIERIHIEEDTAKSLHHKDKTLLNYNRCGVPLIEIVSKPDMKSKEEAMEYAKTLREILYYAGVSDCKIEEGSMRCDVNISVSKTEKLGTRSEIKNIGSISNIGDAIDMEMKRQIKKLESKEALEEDTRRFDSSKEETIFMRKKEPNKDYRFLPEPDIPYLYITDEMILKAKENLEILPNERRKLYQEKNIPELNINKLIQNKELSDYINQFLEENINFKIASNILLGDISSYLNSKRTSIFSTNLTKEKFISLVNYLEEGKISSKIMKEILNKILETPFSLDEIIKSEGASQISDKDEIIKIIKTVLEKNINSAIEYKNGKENAFKFLMGMVMKESKGKVNPKLASEYLKEEINNI